ncbi:MAG: hypothetical protein QOJ84_4309 [Bradyrhizobium sp.]|jgi:hypothetical protein|nr:hypothetical protein [Bradyrhizobium sp.]
MTAIWDEAFLKQHERDAREDALAVQSDADWESAELLLERWMSDECGGCLDCSLPACRRAFRCVGNKPICMPRCKFELAPGVEQELFENFYAEIQEERRNAAAEGRTPCVERVMKHRVHVEEEVAMPVLPPKPVSDELEKNMRIVREALKERSPAPKPPQSPPRPPPPKLESPPPMPQLPPPPQPLPPPEPAPAAWAPKITPEVEERVNRIWAEYVANPAARFRPEPRIRSLSDDRPWSVPPWWKGER